jgi:hypothetical protein
MITVADALHSKFALQSISEKQIQNWQYQPTVLKQVNTV